MVLTIATNSDAAAGTVLRSRNLAVENSDALI